MWDNIIFSVVFAHGPCFPDLCSTPMPMKTELPVGWSWASGSLLLQAFIFFGFSGHGKGNLPDFNHDDAGRQVGKAFVLV